MGGALGLAVLASLAEARTDALAVEGDAIAALSGGYNAAFLVGALFALAAAGVAAALLRPAASPRAGAAAATLLIAGIPAWQLDPRDWGSLAATLGEAQAHAARVLRALPL